MFHNQPDINHSYHTLLALTFTVSNVMYFNNISKTFFFNHMDRKQIEMGRLTDRGIGLGWAAIFGISTDDSSSEESSLLAAIAEAGPLVVVHK